MWQCPDAVSITSGARVPSRNTCLPRGTTQSRSQTTSPRAMLPQLCCKVRVGNPFLLLLLSNTCDRAGLTAVTLISEAYNVQPGDRVLVHTVAGGMGLCLAQLISARGATVIGTTSTPEKAEIAKAHGAAHVILYKQEDVVKRVLELTDGKGVNAIYDAVGKDTSVHVPSYPVRNVC